AERAFKMLFEGIAPAAPGGAASAGGHRTASSAGAARRQRLVEKEYTAICWGAPPDGMVDVPLEPDPDNPLRVKMRIARGAGGLSAQTRLHTLERAKGYSLVRCELLTGRQHQIRIHLAHLGCPVVGDKLYGPDDRLLARAADGELTEADLRRLELPRHALHASRYRLAHPLSGAQLDLVAPLAPDLANFWRRVSGSEAGAAPELQGEGHQALVEVLTK
ncbi:MAG TPA: pseudouridine synthase, partial [Polyangiaceae bacterium]|nr:pseudouridine synthase [Polyangiaceae bacterium]